MGGSFHASKSSKMSGDCTKIPTLARSITSLCACAVTSRMTPPNRGICSPYEAWDIDFSPIRTRSNSPLLSAACPEQTSLPLERFQFIQRAWPVGFQQTRETSIRQHFTSGLAACAIIGFIIGIANTENFFSAPRTSFPIAAVHGHAFAKSGNFFGETRLCFALKPVDPQFESLARSCEQPPPFFRR